MLEEDAEALRAGEATRHATERAVRMAVASRRASSATDEREAGAARSSTSGTPWATRSRPRRGFGTLRHGEAVALGLVAAFRVGRALGRASEPEAARCGRCSSGWGCRPGSTPSSTRPRARSSSDKKRAAGKVGFVVPGAPGDVAVTPLGLDALGPMVRGGG